ncbi:hypothetical protein CYG49_04875 [Candidatus Saccharibacteria bacterium]|nr:MAG: hypothetical protein CYG49_04875 [Candidatus Saccharibacteria bacterium]
MNQQHGMRGEFHPLGVDLVTLSKLESSTSRPELERTEALLELLDETMERTGSNALLGEFEAYERKKYGLSPQVQHTRRVGAVGLLTGIRLGLPSHLAFRIAYAGTTHDMGKRDPEINNVVNSHRKFTRDDPEREIINQHSSVGADILTTYLHADNEFDITCNTDAIFAAAYHHATSETLQELLETAPDQETRERVEITRLTQVLDVYDALTDPLRSYRNGVDRHEVAKAIVVSHLGEETVIFGVRVADIVEMLPAIKQQLA